MGKALGPRFYVEALFLFALAGVMALLHLRPITILIVMAGAWAALAAFEWAFFRGPRVETVEIPVGEGHEAAVFDGPPEVVHEPRPEPELEPEPEPEPEFEVVVVDVEVPADEVLVAEPEPELEVLVVEVEVPADELLVAEPEPEPEPEPEFEVVVVDVEVPADEVLVVELEPESGAPVHEPEPEPEPVFAPLSAAPPLEPEAPEYIEEIPAAATDVVDIAAHREGPREWNLWELERLAREQSGSDALRDEERSFLLMYLREFADADGLLPVDFDGLVRDSFGDLLAAAGR